MTNQFTVNLHIAGICNYIAKQIPNIFPKIFLEASSQHLQVADFEASQSIKMIICNSLSQLENLQNRFAQSTNISALEKNDFWSANCIHIVHYCQYYYIYYERTIVNITSYQFLENERPKEIQQLTHFWPISPFYIPSGGIKWEH